MQRTLESTALADSVSEADTMLAVSAVVTREGRVSDLLVLANDHQGRQVSSILDAISQTRLQPAELAGSPVAVEPRVAARPDHRQAKGRSLAGSRLL